MDVAKFWAAEDKLTIEERRARYACIDYVTTEQIPSWADYFEHGLKVDVIGKICSSELLTMKTKPNFWIPCKKTLPTMIFALTSILLD